MDYNLLVSSVFLSVSLVAAMLWYTTEKENENWEVLFFCLQNLLNKLEENEELKSLEITADYDKLKDAIADCLEVVESKVDIEESDHYYNQNGIEAWDIIHQVMEYHEGNISNKEAGILYNIMKYLMRFPYKGQRNSDLDKVCDYAEQLKVNE